MSRAILLTICAALLTAAGPVPTEAPLGSVIKRASPARVPVLGHTQDEMERITLANFARCTFGRRPSQVAADLALSFQESLPALNKHVVDACLDDATLQMPPALYCGYLFGEMYRRHENERGKPWTYPSIPLDLVSPITADMPATRRVNRFMLALADCLHTADAANMRMIVVAEPASSEQRAAYRQIIPRLSSCLPKDATFELNRSGLESAFGEYLYRSLATTAPASTGKSN